MSSLNASLSTTTNHIPIRQERPAYCAELTPTTSTPIGVGAAFAAAAITAYAAGFGIGQAAG